MQRQNPRWHFCPLCCVVYQSVAAVMLSKPRPDSRCALILDNRRRRAHGYGGRARRQKAVWSLATSPELLSIEWIYRSLLFNKYKFSWLDLGEITCYPACHQNHRSRIWFPSFELSHEHVEKRQTVALWFHYCFLFIVRRNFNSLGDQVTISTCSKRWVIRISLKFYLLTHIRLLLLRGALYITGSNSTWNGWAVVLIQNKTKKKSPQNKDSAMLAGFVICSSIHSFRSLNPGPHYSTRQMKYLDLSWYGR